MRAIEGLITEMENTGPKSRGYWIERAKDLSAAEEKSGDEGLREAIVAKCEAVLKECKDGNSTFDSGATRAVQSVLWEVLNYKAHPTDKTEKVRLTARRSGQMLARFAEFTKAIDEGKKCLWLGPEFVAMPLKQYEELAGVAGKNNGFNPGPVCYDELHPTPKEAPEGLVDSMVEQFLKWELPEDFSPDGGIQFNPAPGFRPIGTNLLTATQAKEMFEKCLPLRDWGGELADRIRREKCVGCCKKSCSGCWIHDVLTCYHPAPSRTGELVKQIRKWQDTHFYNPDRASGCVIDRLNKILRDFEGGA